MSTVPVLALYMNFFREGHCETNRVELRSSWHITTLSESYRGVHLVRPSHILLERRFIAASIPGARTACSTFCVTPQASLEVDTHESAEDSSRSFLLLDVEQAATDAFQILLETCHQVNGKAKTVNE